MPKVTDRHGRPVAGQMPGLVEAVVTDNVDPAKLGRVKVKFVTLPGTNGGDEPMESYWARLVMPMAGQERGWMTIPEIGDEVIVSFMHGDIQNAIVMGAVYNGVDTPPYANEDEENNLRVFQSRSGHRVTFDDTAGEERVELISHNEEIKVIWDAKEKTISVYSGKDIIIEAKETISMKCKDFILGADKSVSVEAGQTMDLKAGQSMTGDGGSQMTLKAGTININ
ncbi:MAG: phage baseplate assembly protein V [Alphaproteobacteria bacterium]|nr:phage baseplate assembly protein V [Alphaproteobacteria bacterium]